LKEGDGFDQIGNNPCNTILFRGLDALTTEETLMAAVTTSTNLPVKNIKIIRDDVTNTSRGYAFAEMNSIKDSSYFLEFVNANGPFEVDGKAIMVSFAKNTFTTTMATLAQARNQQQSSSSYYPTAQDLIQQGYYYDQASGQYYDSNGQPFDYATYYQQYPQSAEDPGSTQTDVTKCCRCSGPSCHQASTS